MRKIGRRAMCNPADCTAFNANRHVVSQGLIKRLDVRNDSAEWLLARAGLAML